MPLLTELATVIIDKTKTSDAQKSLFALRRKMPQEELKLVNRLKTQVVVGNESHMDKIKLPSSESKGIFANWRSELERTPKYDLYEQKPLNIVKDDTLDAIKEYEEYEIQAAHEQWLRGVDARMKKLGFKP